MILIWGVTNKQEETQGMASHLETLTDEAEYSERTTDHGQATGKLYHLRLRVECTLFLFY